MSILEANAIVGNTGYSKSSKYVMFFSGPTELIPSNASRRLSVTCEDCFFPGRTVFTSEIRHYGPMFKVPYVINYNNEVTMTFRIGSDFYEKRLFEEWMDMMVDKRNHDIAYYDNYVQTLKIAQINDQLVGLENNNPSLKNEVKNLFSEITENLKEGFKNNIGLGNNGSTNINNVIRIGEEPIVYAAELRELYPISIQELPLGHGNIDQLHRIIVTFAYKTYVNLPELKNNDVSYLTETSIDEADHTLDTRGRAASGGRVIDIIERGSQVGGIIFNRGNGQLLSF